MTYNLSELKTIFTYTNYNKSYLPVPFGINIQKLKLTLWNTKFWILQAIKVIDFLFFSYSLINRHHSSWLLAYMPAIALKAAAAECGVDLTRIVFSVNSLYIFWPTSGLKVSTNELTSWIGC